MNAAADSSIESIAIQCSRTKFRSMLFTFFLGASVFSRSFFTGNYVHFPKLTELRILNIQIIKMAIFLRIYSMGNILCMPAWSAPFVAESLSTPGEIAIT